MPDGKWISGLSSETPVVEAARRVLEVRLGVVEHFLPLAARHAREDVEYVHHLRVATRRTGAALKIFKMCLPKKRGKEVRAELRNIRQVAGKARDWDVFLIALGEWAATRSATERRGLDFLQGYALERRASVQPGLVALAEEGFDPKTILAAVGEPEDFDAPRRLGQLAELMINDLLAAFDAAIVDASDDLEHLHRVRILGKRVRYAMEIFADCFVAQFRHELYPAVEQVQEILGGINDSRTATQRLGNLADELRAGRAPDWRRYGMGIEQLLKHHQTRIPELQQQFNAWREEWRELRASGLHWSPITRATAQVTEKR